VSVRPVFRWDGGGNGKLVPAGSAANRGPHTSAVLAVNDGHALEDLPAICAGHEQCRASNLNRKSVGFPFDFQQVLPTAPCADDRWWNA
jgi:hypothetical protein